MDFALSAAVRVAKSALIEAASALPSSITAVIPLAYRLFFLDLFWQ
jgi:hypothetical protein